MTKKSGKSALKLPNVYQISKAASQTVWQNKGLFAGITIVYGLLNLILVQGIAGTTDTASLKGSLDQIFTGNFGSLASGLSIFAVMLSSSGNSTSQTAGVYQFFLAIICSLAIIWALRQVLASKKLRVRDAFYRGMYPLIPFILLLIVIGLQLLPFLIGSSIFATVMSQGIAVYFIEKLFWGLLLCVLSLVTLYLLSSSLFALYIVTLVDMTPLKALRSAKELVKNRRWIVMRKIVFLPVILLVVAVIIMVPIIVWLTPLAQWVFFILTMSLLLVIHAYMYTLYRELLNE